MHRERAVRHPDARAVERPRREARRVEPPVDPRVELEQRGRSASRRGTRRARRPRTRRRSRAQRGQAADRRRPRARPRCASGAAVARRRRSRRGGARAARPSVIGATPDLEDASTAAPTHRGGRAPSSSSSTACATRVTTGAPSKYPAMSSSIQRAGEPRRAAPNSADVRLEVEHRRAVDRVEPLDSRCARPTASTRHVVRPRRFGRSFARWARIPTLRPRSGCPAGAARTARAARRSRGRRGRRRRRG